MVQHHIKVALIPPVNGAYLNLDEEIIARAPIFDSKKNLKLNQESLDKAYLDHQCNTFKTNGALVYQILSKVFMDTNAYIYMKQRNGTDNC